MSFKASAPGSLMLLGEYAVLYGKKALVCALDQRISVTLTPRADEEIHIVSTLLGTHATSIKQLEIVKPFQFVLGVLQQYQTRLKMGCDIQIEADFSSTIGFGSSAAVTVATLAALMSWLQIRVTPLELIRHGRQVIRLTQGVGSGADVAAAVLGGMVTYETEPLIAEKISFTYPLQVLYSGYKTPTPEVIAQVQQRFASHPVLFRSIIHSIGQCAMEGIQYARQQAWKKMGDMMTIQHHLLAALGVSPTLQQAMVEVLLQQTGILGAKISGSGMGDCVIGLGECGELFSYPNKPTQVEVIPVNMSLQGVSCEKI